MVLYYVGIDYYCQNLKFFPPTPPQWGTFVPKQLIFIIRPQPLSAERIMSRPDH